MCGGSIEIENVNPDHISIVIDKLIESGVRIKTVKNSIIVNGNKKIKVEIKIGKDDKLLLVVSDDGPGLSLQQMNKVFARGFRLDEQKPGTGLGLNIVKDIIETYMKGNVELKKSNNLVGIEVNISITLSRSYQVT